MSTRRRSRSSDFHNRLSLAQIAANHTFADLGEAWLAGNHYQWRAGAHGYGRRADA